MFKQLNITAQGFIKGRGLGKLTAVKMILPSWFDHPIESFFLQRISEKMLKNINETSDC